MSASGRDSEWGYRRTLRELQIELVAFQRHLIEHDLKVLLIIEGRDASGKDGLIKRFVEHLSPRETRVVALGKPSDRDRTSWHFSRYVPHLPTAQEMVLFNRSWYNRAGVERVHGFCSDAEYEDFMETVVPFERMLLRSGIQIFKYYLDISRDEQRKRLKQRRKDPLKQWKVSPIDQVALERWDDYTSTRNAMLRQTHRDETPWQIVRADRKKSARLNLIRHFLASVECPGKREHLARPDPDVVMSFGESLIADGVLAS